MARSGRDGKKDKGGEGSDHGWDDLIRALNHELRRRILRLLHDSEEPLSPARLARALDVPLGSCSYHVRVLKGYGALATEEERPVRGTIEHFYVSKVADDPAILGILEATREADDEAKESSSH